MKKPKRVEPQVSEEATQQPEPKVRDLDIDPDEAAKVTGGKGKNIIIIC